MNLGHQRERELFARACELSIPAEREAFLAEACGSDVSLRQELERMLEFQPAAEAFLAPDELSGPGPRPSLAPSATVVVGEAQLKEGLGSVIGRYKLLEQIGEGGFGVVFLAEQVEPIRRRVALKIIKLGMDTREIVARFEAERQALALMDHPNVARVLDAGSTPSGRPFFVMELVRGVPITDYCDQNRLTTRERLSLFILVCQAVQHAHQKGVIHRDLKPSNILVTVPDGRPVPKVIDFGVAKAIQQPLTGKTLFTHFGEMIGTPAYMSPEQAELGGLDVDTRCDIYSLGVILYELLTGKPPFDPQRLRQAGYSEMQRILHDEEPPRPSTRLRTLGGELAAVALQRRVEPARLSALLRGDLDWIVMKALEKERARRYPTANGLANDLERHLKEEPVSAGPPQVTYRLRKFIRRHRAAVAAGTGMVVALMAGLLLATVAFLHAREQRDRALLAERTADQERRLALAEGQRARLGELRARQISYASDMSLALHSLDNSNLGRTLQLLNRHRSLAGQNDLRGWEWRYLWQQCQGGALFELCKHSNSVFSVAGSPDGAWLAVGGFDGALQVWDLLARRLAATLQEQAPYCVAAFCPTGKLLAAVGTDGTVTLWEWPGAIALGRLETDGPIRSLSFSADGQKLAGYSAAGTVWVWDPETRRPLNSLKGFGVAQFHGGEAVLSAKGDWVAVGIADGCIRVVDTVTGQELARWQAHPESILALAVSPDDRFLASGAGFTDSSVRLWDARSGALVTNLVGHQAWVSAVVFLPDGKTLASASADQTIRLWDWQQGRATAVLRGSLHEVWSLASLAKSDTLVSGAKDGKVQVWRPKEAPSSGACAAPPLSVHMTAFTGDGAEWVGLLTSGIVVCGHAAAPQSWQPIEALGRDNRAVACRQKDGLLAVATGAGTVTLWDLKRQSVVTNLATADLTPRLGALQFTADGKYLVRARSSSAIAVWETEFWSITASWSTENEELGSIGLSPDGRFLAAGGKVTRVWDLMTGRRVVSFQAHRQPTDTLAFSPDGKVLATGSQEGVAKLWEVGAWRELATLHGHLLGVHALAFSPDSQRLATGSVDRESVKLWDLATTSEVLNLSLPRELVGTLAFSPDGSTLMAVVSGPGVRFWRAPAWAEIAAAEMARSR